MGAPLGSCPLQALEGYGFGSIRVCKCAQVGSLQPAAAGGLTARSTSPGTAIPALGSQPHEGDCCRHRGRAAQVTQPLPLGVGRVKRSVRAMSLSTPGKTICNSSRGPVTNKTGCPVLRSLVLVQKHALSSHVFPDSSLIVKGRGTASLTALFYTSGYCW